LTNLDQKIERLHRYMGFNTKFIYIYIYIERERERERESEVTIKMEL
jgi:hypothetical protein